MGDLIVFRPADPGEEPAATLIAEAEDVMVELYGRTSRIPPDELRAPYGGFVVGWQGEVPVAAGGFVRFDEGRAEIRRMYVRPAARSQGFARLLLTAIEDEMRRAGYPIAILDTGEKQPHAEALYRSAGYEPIENYRGAESGASFWGAKQL